MEAGWLASRTVGTPKRIAPIFPVTDLAVALAHDHRPGFETREYAGGDDGFATLDGVELHLGVADPDGNVIRFGSPIGRPGGNP